MTFSKVVSGMGGAPSGLLKSGTNIASKSGKDWVSYGGRRAALDPAIVFLAELSRDTRDDLGAADTFTRASDGLYLPYNGADWRIAGTNVPRHESAKLLMEPAITNKNTNYNANPDAALTNINELTATKSRVYDPVTLESAGLSSVCSDGNLIQLENTSGANAFPSIGGSVGNTNTHNISIWINTFGANVEIGLSSSRFTVNTSSLQRVGEAVAPTGTGNVLGFLLPDGEKVQFVLNQLEESPVVTSPIITLGAAGQRATDVLEYVNNFWSDAAGTVILYFNPGWSFSNIPIGSSLRPPMWRQTDGVSGMYWEHSTSGFSRLIMRDGAAVFSAGADMQPDPFAGTTYATASRWNSGLNEFEVGVKVNGVWLWPATVATYSGGWNADTWQLGPAAQLPMHLSRCIVYDSDLGRSGVESSF